ncbi:MAG: hypothetical protein RL030_1781 [Pseudomonadota bacterium]
MSDFRLSAGERSDPLWSRLSAYYTERLANLRMQNDTTKTPEQTEKLRGQISEVIALLALGNERKTLI